LEQNATPEIATPPPSVVRPDVPAAAAPTNGHGAKKARAKNARTIEEIRKALGERLTWWEAFWRVYPCHQGTHEAMEVFERRVHNREAALEIYRAAQQYAAQIQALRKTEPTTKVKWAQGWLNSERWLDEVLIPLPVVEGPRKKSKAEEFEEMVNSI
jgi:hypothetical protein